MNKPNLFDLNALTNATPGINAKRPLPGQKLVRRGPRPLALEQRFMFDGAAAADATQVLATSTPEPVLHVEAAAAAADTSRTVDFAADLLRVVNATREINTTLTTAQIEAERVIIEFLQRPEARDQLFTLFNGGQSAPSAQWIEAADAFLASMRNADISVRVELRTNAEMQGAQGAFAAKGPDDTPVIYLNAEWLASGAEAPEITRVLVEEFGHSIDAALNGEIDTAGDEGQRFSAAVVNATTSDGFAMDDDHSILQINGESLAVELAKYTFVGAYEVNIATTPAGKESNTHDFVFTALGQVTIDDQTANQNFSGNDVSAIGLNIGGTKINGVVTGGTNYYGWISRPIKVGGEVKGFYFWRDLDFTDINIAQADGNADADGNVADNRGIILVVDQAYFNSLAYKSGSGTTGIKNVGSSSDRVDSALNALLVPNRAPTPANDALTVLEDSGATTGNVLANDTDPNLDALSITGFSIGGISGTLGAAYTITNVGSFTLSADGSYSFTPVANYSGPVPAISYTVKDSNNATATGTLSITVTPVNDAPTSTNDAVTASEGTTILLGLSDFGTFSDVDGDALAKVQITTLESNGSLEYFNGTSWVTVTLNQEITAASIASGKLRFVPNADQNGSPYTTVGFKVSDGTVYSASAYTLTVNINAGNSAPVANADTAPDAIEASGTANGTPGTNPTGNVLTNDTDVDGAITDGTTHKVTLVSHAGASTSSAVTTGTTSVSSPASVAGLYGMLKIGADGSYIYEVDNNNATVQALLSSANTLTEVFSYSMADGAGAGTSVTSTLTVVIKGANDAPVAVNDYDSVQETALTSGNYGTTTGNVLPNDTDVDSGDTKTVVLDGTTPPASSDKIFTASSPISAVTLAVTQVSGSWTAIVSNSVQTAVWLDSTGATVAKDRAGNTLTVIRTGSGGGATLVFSDNVALYSYQSTNLYIKDSGNANIATLTVAITSATTSASTIVSTSSTDINNIAVSYEVSGAGVTAGTTVTAINLTTKEITLSTSVNITNTSLTFHNPNGISLTASQAYKAGTYGYLIIDQSGAYTYTLTSNALTSGQTFTENFNYTAKDGQNLTSAAVLSVVISGNTSITMDDESASTNEDITLTVADGDANDLMVGDSGVSTISTFSWGGTTANSGQTITIANVGALTINANGSFTFDPVDNYTGAVPSAIYTVAEGGSGSLNLTITATNDAPTSTNDSVTALEDTPKVLSVSDFGVFSDQDGNSLTKVQITTLETNGSLEYFNGTNWVAVTLNQEVTVADINAGKLRFVPTSDESGTPYTTVGFKVHDGTTYSSAYTLTVNVSPVNDAPVNTVPGTQTLFDYQTLTFGAGLSVNDVDSSTDIASVNLTVTYGQLSASTAGGGGATGAGTVASPLVLTGTKAQLDTMLASMVYQPNSGFSGADALRIVTTDAGGLSDTDYVDITVSPDNRALTISGSTVNEASPYVLFTVTGATGQKVSLSLNSGSATISADFLPNLEYFNGTAWTAYTGSAVSIPGGGTTLLVRAAVLQDMLNEGSETLILTATNKAGAAATGTNTSYIKDDGTGGIYLEGNLTGTANISTDSGFPSHLDDDRPITVNNITVNEASPYAVFTVTGATGQVVKLSMSSGTATIGTDTESTFEVHNGAGWVAYTTDTDLALSGSTLLVRTTITQDATFEGQEAFILKVTKQSAQTSVYGTGSIYDDGTGSVFIPGNTTGTPDTSGTGYPAALDDDRTIAISSPTVNEGSDLAIFTITGNSGQTAVLEYIAGTANALGTPAIKVWDGKNTAGIDQWVTYDATKALPTFDANGKIFVSVAITGEQDTAVDNGETFQLKATLAEQTFPAGTPTNTLSTTKIATGTATIVDDGTGVKFSNVITVNSPTDRIPETVTTSLDDDRVLTVAPVTVLESAGYMVFEVNGAVGQMVTLAVEDGTANFETSAATGVDAHSLQYKDAAGNWQSYSTAVSIPMGGKLEVRVSITDDTEAEGSQNISLKASNASGTAFSGVGTITDNDIPALTYSSNTFSEAGSNIGTIATAVTITLANDTYSTDVVTASKIVATNVPIGLTATFIRTSDTVITATLTGTAAAHANANDIANLTFTFQNGAFNATATASNVTGYAKSDLVVDFVDSGDTTPPTIAITTNDAALQAGETATLTFTLSEASNDFVVGDITVSGGTLSNFSGSGTSYSATFTPTADSTTPASVSVASAKFSDAAGNSNTDGADANNSVAMTVDTNLPMVSASQSLSYAENQSANAVVGTVAASDAVGVTGFRFTNAGGSAGSTSTDGFYSIASDGKISLTAAGVAAGVAQNDFETTPNSFTYGIQARDAAGNWSSSVDVALNVTDDVQDNPIVVTSPTVNEASPYAVFTIAGVAGQTITLTLAAGSATGDGADFGSGTASANLEYSLDGGTTWIAYSTTPNPTLTGTTLLARTPVIEDTISDSGETLTLTATSSGGRPVVGTATLNDQGGGSIFTADGSTNNSTTLSDDRPLTVSSPTVSEASPFVVFTVTGQSGQKMTLVLESDSATIGIDTGSTLQYFDGSTWQSYTPGSLVTLPVGGTLLVRTSINNDGAFEGSESLRLKASNTGGNAYAGTAAIKDDGSPAVIFSEGYTTGTPITGESNDDRPKPVAPAVPVTPTPEPAPEPAPIAAPPEPVSAPVVTFSPAVVDAQPAPMQAPGKAEPIGEILTSNAGFRVTVTEAKTPSLALFRGITDQFIEGNKPATFALPSDAFVHTQADAVVTLSAKLANGKDLPDWVQFDARSGTFQLNPPAGFNEELQIKVMARDSEGREASSIFKFTVGEGQGKVSPTSRSSLSEQIRLASKRSSPWLDLVRVPDSKGTPDKVVPNRLQATRVQTQARS